MSQAKLVHDHSGIDFSLPNEEIFYKVTGDDTDGLFDYFDLRVGHLKGFPLHIHEKQHETFHVVEGELLLQVDGEWTLAKKGDFIFVPKGVEHTYINVRRQPTHSVGIISPGGFDKFVAEIQAYVRSTGGHPDQNRINEISANHDQKWTGPPLANSLGLVPDPDVADVAKQNLDTLQGTWDLVASGFRGKQIPEEEVKGTKGGMNLDGNMMRIYAGHDAEGVAKFDPTQVPMTVDILHLTGPLKGETGLGIYELDGDTLTLCWAVTGIRDDRPDTFSNGPEDDVAMNTYQRRRR